MYEDPLLGLHVVFPAMPSLLQVLQETYISLAQGPTTCFAVPELALVVLDESLEVLLEVLVVVALHIQAKNLVVLGVHMVYNAALLANESQDSIHLSILQHIHTEVVPANPAVASHVHPSWASRVLVASVSSSVAFAPTFHP